MLLEASSYRREGDAVGDAADRSISGSIKIGWAPESTTAVKTDLWTLRGIRILSPGPTAARIIAMMAPLVP